MASTPPYLVRVHLKEPAVGSDEYPFSLPIVRGLDIEFASPVTFFVGENGTGKSTIIEALAALCRLPVSGGGRTRRFSHSTATPSSRSPSRTPRTSRSPGASCTTPPSTGSIFERTVPLRKRRRTRGRSRPGEPTLVRRTTRARDSGDRRSAWHSRPVDSSSPPSVYDAAVRIPRHEKDDH